MTKINPEITDLHGEPRKFLRMTDRLCQVCNPASHGAKMGVVFDHASSTTLECPECGAVEHVTAPSRQMNDSK